MTIDVVEDLPRRIQYTALAAQVDFDYPFPIFADEDLLVRVDGVVQVLTTDYTVAGATNETGGTITFLMPLTGGEIVTIWSDLAIERNSDFQQNGPWTSVSTNDQFDLLTIICQELAQKIKRCIRWPFTATQTDAGLELEPIDAWKSKYLFVDSDGHLTPTAATGGAPTASDVSYDNGASGLSATDVQAAIDEIAAGGSVAGANTEVQFNDGGALGADPAFKFNKATKTLTLGAADDFATIVTPDGASNQVGGDLFITAGKGAGSSSGGGITVTAGSDVASGELGGNLTLDGGDPGVAGGDARMQGGSANGSASGAQGVVQGGDSVDGAAGDAVLVGGVASGSGADGSVILEAGGLPRVAALPTGAVEFNGDAGTAAQVLTSAGPSAPPVWASAGSADLFDTQIYEAEASDNSGAPVATPTGWTISWGASSTTQPALDGSTLIGSMTKLRATSAASNNNTPQHQFGNGSSPFPTSVFRRISGDAAAGGFKLQYLFSPQTARNDQAVFLTISTAVGDNTLGGIVSTAYATYIALGQDQTDGTLQWMERSASGTVTKTAVGVTWASLQGKLCLLTIYCAPGGTTAEVTLRNITDNVNYTATLNTTLPAADIPLHPFFQISTGTAASTAVAIDFMRCKLTVYRKI